jgi:hypothetical protein
LSDQALILTLFLLAWVFICFALAHFGGWRLLGHTYPSAESFRGRRFRFQSGQLGGWVGYNACLTVGADRRGLFLKVWPIFRLGHPPLFVPWPDVTAFLEKRRWLAVVVLTFARVPSARVRITHKLADRLAAESQGSFDVAVA